MFRLSPPNAAASMGRLVPWLSLGMRGVVCCALYLVASVSTVLGDEPTAPVNSQKHLYFENEIVPLLISRCLECHSENEKSGGLSLESWAQLQTGGDSGPALDNSDLPNSLLWQRVKTGEMPPPRQGLSQELAASEKEILQKWLASGATWPPDRKLDLFERTTKTRGGLDWWSLQTPRSEITPLVNTNASRGQSNFIDAFIDQQLEKNSWKPAPPASREVLLRRLYWDVTGLAPSADDIQEFVNDTEPDAYERRVDKLLASPQFGVRWSRYWLDLVRYADTSGYERDQEKAFGWKYRDWVVRAWNDDLPYDSFLRWQLAGDEVPTTSTAALERDELIATGFIRLGTWNDEPNDPADYVYERLEDMVHTTGSAFLGLTIKCARCHDHKFDPISQTDYYRMGSVFWGGPVANRSSQWLGGPNPTELPGEILGWTDLSSAPPPLHRLKKGETKHPLEAVAPATPSFVPALFKDLEPPNHQSTTSQRRKQLADWMLHSDHPLTSRVIINRLWQNHFGEGLVRSPNNWGFTGELPTHPELLDYLAKRLQASNWSLKRLHREMLLSRTYQQSSIHPQQSIYAQTDASNRMWWRANMRRTDAESLRDRLLQSVGGLDLKMYGPGFRPPLPRDVLDGLSMKSRAWLPSPASEQARRSLYFYAQRSLAIPLMNTFDACDTAQVCAQREATTVAPQALALLNNLMVVQPCETLAARLVQQSGSKRTQIEQLWQLILKRNPTEVELERGVSFLASQQRTFEAQLQLPEASAANRSSIPVPTPQLEFAASADTIQIENTAEVQTWQSATAGTKAFANQPLNRPRWSSTNRDELPYIHFDGQKRFLTLEPTPKVSDHLSFLAVIRDHDAQRHRQIFSNWNGNAGNSVTSFFVGITGEGHIRISDDYTTAATLGKRHQWHVLAVVCGSDDVRVYVDGTMVEHLGRPLTPRNYSGNYVIGQQGNIDGEYFAGDIALLRLYDSALPEATVQALMQPWCDELGLTTKQPTPDAGVLALASLAQVLVSSNEFLYID